MSNKRFKELVQSVKDYGADINKATQFGETPLHLAVQYDDTKIAKELIEDGADVNTEDARYRTPISIASRQGYVDMCKLLVRELDK